MFNDKTSGKNHYFVISGDGVAEGLFTINRTSGVVYSTREVDRETTSCYHVSQYDITNQSHDKYR